VIDNQLYIFGGDTKWGDKVNLITNAFQMDCDTKSIQQLPSLQEAQSYGRAVYHENKIYFVGAYLNDESYKSEIVAFDLVTQIYANAFFTNPAVTGAAAVSFGGNILIFGGEYAWNYGTDSRYVTANAQTCLLPTSPNPTSNPSYPTTNPSILPTVAPSTHPSRKPSVSPSEYPSNLPSSQPSVFPSQDPTYQPSQPSSLKATANPTTNPSDLPSLKPSAQSSTEELSSTFAAATNSDGSTVQQSSSVADAYKYLLIIIVSPAVLAVVCVCVVLYFGRKCVNMQAHLRNVNHGANADINVEIENDQGNVVEEKKQENDQQHASVQLEGSGIVAQSPIDPNRNYKPEGDPASLVTPNHMVSDSDESAEEMYVAVVTARKNTEPVESTDQEYH